MATLYPMQYTVTHASKNADVSKTAIRLWCADWAEFLSDSANPPKGKKRQFTLEDIAVFRTIKTLRDKGMNSDQIREELNAGNRYEPVGDGLPPTPPNEPTEHQNDGAKGQSEQPNPASMALELVQGQIESLTNERNYLRQTVESERNRANNLLERAVQAETISTMLQVQLDQLTSSPSPPPPSSQDTATNNPSPPTPRRTFRQWWRDTIG